MSRRKRREAAAAGSEFAHQCIWTTGSKQCRLRQVWSPSLSGGPGFCSWHFFTSHDRSTGRDRREFSEWLAVEIERDRALERPEALYSESELWAAVTGEESLPVRVRPPVDRGIVSRELNGFVIRKPDGLLWQVIDRRVSVDVARRMLAERAAEIRGRYEEEVFG